MAEAAPSSTPGSPGQALGATASAALPGPPAGVRVERPPPGPAQGTLAVSPGVILAAGAGLVLAVLGWYWHRRRAGRPARPTTDRRHPGSSAA